MRKLVAGEFVSLDGVYQAPGGPQEDTDGGFAYGGWTVPHFSDDMGQFMAEFINTADAYLLGRRTYDIFAGAWPLVTDDSDPIASKLNNAPKYVASNTLKTADWKNTTILSGDAVARVAELKQQPGGDIQMAGSGALIQTLLKNDLLDEVTLIIFPIVIGAGKRLFGDGALPRTFKLVNTRVFDSGVIVATYQRAGELVTGEYGPETGNYEPVKA
jgi:dihydrofolate reductase